MRRALDAARRFRAARRSGGGATGKKGERVTVHEARLRSDSSALRDACARDAWRGFGLTDPSHERLLRRRAEQTLDIARVNGDGTTVTYLTFKLAMHRVAARHVAGLRLALADARAARGDDRGALREYRRALTEERAGWARTGRLERAPASSLLNAARLTRVRAGDQADLDNAEGGCSARRRNRRNPGTSRLEDQLEDHQPGGRLRERRRREGPPVTISACSCARAIIATTTRSKSCDRWGIGTGSPRRCSATTSTTAPRWKAE